MTINKSRLGEKFFKQNAVVVARQLIGKLLIRKIKGQEIICKIVETEAYNGPQDKASHAYQNNRTKRTEVMFNIGGYTYIYLIYGMYYCFNIVTGCSGRPEAVLIRAVEPLAGIDLIKKNRKIKSKKKEDLTNGPGKLCQALKIDKNLNKYCLVNGSKLYLQRNKSQNNFKINIDKRVNIDYAEDYRDKLWRFYLKDCSFVSKKS